MTDLSLPEMYAAESNSPRPSSSCAFPRIADYETLVEVLANERAESLSVALARASRDVVLRLISELPRDEQFQVVQQLVNVRTTAHKTSLEVARLLPQREPLAAPEPLAKAS